MQVEDTVNGEVQIVRDGFSVVTLPDFSCMPAHVSLMDFNERLASVKPSLSSTLKLRVQELPSESNGRTLTSKFSRGYQMVDALFASAEVK